MVSPVNGEISNRCFAARGEILGNSASSLPLSLPYLFVNLENLLTCQGKEEKIYLPFCCKLQYCMNMGNVKK